VKRFGVHHEGIFARVGDKVGAEELCARFDVEVNLRQINKTFQMM
jgi:hypothetical protein